MRACGDCRLCCKVFPLPVLEKPAGTWCRHVLRPGLRNPRPRQARSLPPIRLLLARARRLPRGMASRPDRHRRHRVRQRDDWLSPVAGRALAGGSCGECLFRSRAGGCGPGSPGSLCLARLCRDDHPRLGRRIEFDRARWPDISPQDIETALRCELSRDAAELKRLGAVGDDYQPLDVPSPAGRGLG